MPEVVQEKNAEEAKESKELATKEAARVAVFSEDLAEKVVMGQVVDEQEEEMQKKNAMVAAAAMDMAQHEKNASDKRMINSRVVKRQGWQLRAQLLLQMHI